MKVTIEVMYCKEKEVEVPDVDVDTVDRNSAEYKGLIAALCDAADGMYDEPLPLQWCSTHFSKSGKEVNDEFDSVG